MLAVAGVTRGSVQRRYGSHHRLPVPLGEVVRDRRDHKSWILAASFIQLSFQILTDRLQGLNWTLRGRSRKRGNDALFPYVP